MAASWRDACRASIEMMKATQDACDPELQSKTEQHATTTLTQKLQQVGSLKPEDIAELGKLVKEAELPSGWGKDLLRAAAQRKLDLSIEAKPEKKRPPKTRAIVYMVPELFARTYLGYPTGAIHAYANQLALAGRARRAVGTLLCRRSVSRLCRGPRRGHQERRDGKTQGLPLA